MLFFSPSLPDSRLRSGCSKSRRFSPTFPFFFFNELTETSVLGAALGACRCCAGAGCHQELPYSSLTAPSCRRNSLETLNLPQKCSGRHSQVIFLPRTLLTDRNRAAHVRARRLGEVSQGSTIALLLPGLSEPAPQDVSLHPQQNLPFFFFFSWCFCLPKDIVLAQRQNLICLSTSVTLGSLRRKPWRLRCVFPI